MSLDNIARLIEIADYLPEAVARERKVLVLEFDGEAITLARPDSGFSEYDRECLEFILSRPLNWRLFPASEIEKVMEYVYGRVGQITGCTWEFKFKCPKEWNALAVSDDDMVRNCSSCAKPVFLCSTDDEITQHAKNGDCVCIVTEFGMSTGDVILQDVGDNNPIDFTDCLEDDAENA